MPTSPGSLTQCQDAEGSPVATESKKTYCRVCTAHCGLVVTIRDTTLVEAVRGDPGHPISQGYTCRKGRDVGRRHHDPRRLDDPWLGRGDSRRRVSWDDALESLAAQLRSIVEGADPDAVGLYLGTASAMDGLARRAFETLLRRVGSISKFTALTVDTPCKPLVSEAMGGFANLVPHIDWDNSELVIFAGTNPVVSHGHFNPIAMPGRRLREFQERGELWVVDPCHTETARLTPHHIAPRPGTDFAIFAGIIRELLQAGADVDFLARHAVNVSALQEAVSGWDLPTVSQYCAVDEALLRDLVTSVRRAGRVSVQTGTGISMSERANVTEWMVWALQIVTGSYDQPGGSWFNPGYLTRLDERALGGSSLARSGPALASRPDLVARWGEFPAAGIVDEIEAGNLRALVVVGGNLLTALPEPGRVRAALGRLDVLVVVDVLENEMCDLATHVLPAAGLLERADAPVSLDLFQPFFGTQYTPALVPLAAQRKPAWWVAAELSRRLGHEPLEAGSTGEVTDETLIQRVVDRSQGDFDELRAARLVETDRPFGWVTDQVLAQGRWDLMPEIFRAEGLPQPEPTSVPSGLRLLPRRQLSHMNSYLVSGQSTLPDENEVASIQLHPSDADARGIADAQAVIVRSKYGVLHGCARFDERRVPGSISVPHGYGALNVSELTSSVAALDPLTGMPVQSGLEVEVLPDPDTRRE